MRRTAVVLAAICFLSEVRAAWAHRVDEYLQATLLTLTRDRIDASMRLVPGVLVAPAVIAAIDTNHDGVFSQSETRAYAERVVAEQSTIVDGRPSAAHIDHWSFPESWQLRDGQGEIAIQYHVDMPPSGKADRSFGLANRHLNTSSVYLVNVEVPQDHSLEITAQKRNSRQSAYELDYTEIGASGIAANRLSSMWTLLTGEQVASLFNLGVRHIAEGTDHLLFLLALLLPAPLLAAGPRWRGPASVRQSLRRIAGIVTAFTLGHSVTLALAVFGIARVPGRPVEVLIAVSIFVSACHALRPIVPGREFWIAALFGLVHGLAFATTLDRLGLSRLSRVIGLVYFNLGIEAMQMLVVVLVLPSLLLLSRTKEYSILRIGGALFASAASIGWIVTRLSGVQTPVDTVADTVARRGAWLAVALFVISVVCFARARRADLRWALHLSE